MNRDEHVSRGRIEGLRWQSLVSYLYMRLYGRACQAASKAAPSRPEQTRRDEARKIHHSKTRRQKDGGPALHLIHVTSYRVQSVPRWYPNIPAFDADLMMNVRPGGIRRW
jgi:hypothetical protein